MTIKYKVHMAQPSEKAILKASVDGGSNNETIEQDAETIYRFLREHIPDRVYRRLKRKMILGDNYF
ncbi:MAG TPA: hypothetical protein VJ485_01360 [archaeon]|jgi:hypothetical protein|nr:hypothetical protein [archaeon]